MNKCIYIIIFTTLLTITSNVNSTIIGAYSGTTCYWTPPPGPVPIFITNCTAGVSQLPSVQLCASDGDSMSTDSNEANKACSIDLSLEQFSGSLKNGPAPLPPQIMPFMSPTGNINHAYGIDTMTGHIEDFGINASEKIDNRRKIVVDAYGEMTSSINSSVFNAFDSLRESELALLVNSQEQEMEYMLELKEAEIRSIKGNSTTPSTKEEIEFILFELKKASDEGNEHVQSVVVSMKSKYDNVENFYIPVRYKHTYDSFGDSGCPDYNPSLNGELSNYSCYRSQKGNPGKSLENFFKECSYYKSKQMTSMQNDATKEIEKGINTKPEKILNEESNSLYSLNSSSVKINKINCNSDDLIYGKCYLGEDFTNSNKTLASVTEEILERVADKKIIFDGNIRATSLYKPEVVSSTDGDITSDFNNEDYLAIENGNGEITDEAVSTNTPVLFETYKTSSQYYAANDFSHTVLNRSLLSNLDYFDRNSQNTNKYVSKFLQRFPTARQATSCYGHSTRAVRLLWWSRFFQ